MLRPPPWPRLLLLATAFLAPAACGDADGRVPALVLGVGESAFYPAHDGDTAALVAGAQGGHHVWLSLRAAGLEPEGARMILDVTPTAPAPAAHSEVEIDLTPSGDPRFPDEFVGWPARVLMPECAVDRPVAFMVTLRDARGRTASTELSLIAGAPRLPFAAACAP